MSKKNGHLLENGNIWKQLETFGNRIHIPRQIMFTNKYFNKYGNPKTLKTIKNHQKQLKNIKPDFKYWVSLFLLFLLKLSLAF